MPFNLKKAQSFISLCLKIIGTLSLILFHAAKADVVFLNDYFQSLHTLETEFTQSSKQGKKTEISTGKLYLKPDIGFRFIYQKPFKQEIILNKSHQKLWQYDIDLAQLIIKPIDLTDQSNPISFLLSQTPLSEQFDIKVEKNKTRYLLTPKKIASKQTDRLGIAKLTIIFKNNQLHQFIAIDDTGSTVNISLEQPRFNQNILLTHFIFNEKAYPNLDIIDETQKK